MVTVSKRLLRLLDSSLLGNVVNVRNWHTIEGSLHGNLRHGGDRNVNHCWLQVGSPCLKGMLRHHIRRCIVLSNYKYLLVLEPDLALMSLDFVPSFPFTRGMLMLLVCLDDLVFVNMMVDFCPD